MMIGLMASSLTCQIRFELRPSPRRIARAFLVELSTISLLQPSDDVEVSIGDVIAVEPLLLMIVIGKSYA